MKYAALLFLAACGAQPQSLSETHADLDAQALTKQQLACQVDFFDDDQKVIASSQVLSVDWRFASSYALPVEAFTQRTELFIRGNTWHLDIETPSGATQEIVDLPIGRSLKSGADIEVGNGIATRFGHATKAHFWCATTGGLVPLWGFQPQFVWSKGSAQAQVFVQNENTMVVDFARFMRKRLGNEVISIDVDGTIIELTDEISPEKTADDHAAEFVNRLRAERPDLTVTLDPREDLDDSIQASFATVTIVRSVE